MINIYRICFRYDSNLKQDVIKTGLKVGDKFCYSKQNAVWIKTKTMKQEETYLSPKVLTQQTTKLRYSRIGKVVAAKEETTTLESMLVSSEVFSYNTTPLGSYSPKQCVDASSSRKLKQVKNQIHIIKSS